MSERVSERASEGVRECVSWVGELGVEEGESGCVGTALFWSLCG